jgi:hypothetical protein
MEQSMVTTTQIQTRHLPAQTIAYQKLRGTIASIESATSAVRSWAVTMGYEPQGPVAVEISGEPGADRAAEYDFEVHLPVEDSARAHPDDQVQIKRFEATDAAIMTLNGPFDIGGIGEPLGRMRAWLSERNARGGSMVRWVEVTDPTKVSPDEQVTEIQILVPAGSLPGMSAAPSAGGPATAHDSGAGGARRDAGETQPLPTNTGTPPARDSVPVESVVGAGATALPAGMGATGADSTATGVPPETQHMTSSRTAGQRDDMWDEWEDEEERGGPPWVALGVGLVALGAAVFGLRWWRRRRARRRSVMERALDLLPSGERVREILPSTERVRELVPSTQRVREMLPASLDDVKHGLRRR